MPVLNFWGAIKGDFDSGLNVTYVKTQGQYVDGRYVKQEVSRHRVFANVQPVSDRELDFLSMGGRRIVDARKIYLNEQDTEKYDLEGYFEFLGAKWKPIKVDKRPKRSYMKFTVAQVREND